MKRTAVMVLLVLLFGALFIGAGRQMLSPVFVGMPEQRVAAAFTNQWFTQPSVFRNDRTGVYFVRRKFFVGEQITLVRFQPGGAVTNISTQWKWKPRGW